MEVKITMPKLNPEMEKGIVCAWLKDVGESVSAGEPLYEIESDKVVHQIESHHNGVLKAQLCDEGDSVAVLDDIAVLSVFI